MPDEVGIWTWTRRTFEYDGETFIEWRGESQYHTATVTNFPSTWQGTVHTAANGPQRSPYRATAATAKAWCERYGQPRPARQANRLHHRTGDTIMTTHIAHMLHVLTMLTADYRHIHNLPMLYHAYVRDHALMFLRSGWASGSGGPHYLHFLTWHHVAPLDW